jgi:hypothetical protein
MSESSVRVELLYLDSPIDYYYILALGIPGDRVEKMVDLDLGIRIM